MFWTVGVGRGKRERKKHLWLVWLAFCGAIDGSSSPWPLTCHQGSNEAWRLLFWAEARGCNQGWSLTHSFSVSLFYNQDVLWYSKTTTSCYFPIFQADPQDILHKTVSEPKSEITNKNAKFEVETSCCFPETYAGLVETFLKPLYWKFEARFQVHTKSVIHISVLNVGVYIVFPKV